MEQHTFEHVEPDEDGVSIVFNGEDGDEEYGVINLTWEEAWKLLNGLLKAFGVRMGLLQ